MDDNWLYLSPTPDGYLRSAKQIQDAKLTDHIGIVACSAEGAALCYRTICTEGGLRFGPHGHPEISMHGHSLADYMAGIETGDWAAVAELMLSSAAKLERAGADFLICPDNTIHQALPFAEPHSPLPWLHIASVVADVAAARGYKRVALTGTKWLLESSVYPEKLGARNIEWQIPNVAECENITRLIMDELVRGLVTPAGTSYLQQVIERLRSEGCDAVVLGCTELPLAINDDNSPLPVLDSTRLLARAALERAVRLTPNSD